MSQYNIKSTHSLKKITEIKISLQVFLFYHAMLRFRIEELARITSYKVTQT